MVLRPSLPQLSGRQIEVAVLVADGFSDKQIAGRLAISASAVRIYVLRIARKLGLDESRNRRVLITRAVVEGWARAEEADASEPAVNKNATGEAA